MSNIKCAIFDLDGTLMDTINTIAYYCNKALKTVDLPDVDTEKYKYFVGNGAELLVRRCLEFYNVSDEAAYEKAYTYYNKVYDSDPYYLTEVYEGITGLLYELKSRGIKLAVLSNKPHYPTCEIIKKYFGDDLFSLVYGAREGFPKKPDTTVALSIAKELQAEPSQCIYLGDTNTDMQTGKASGFFTIGVTWGFRTEEELKNNNADAIVRKPAEVLNCL